MFIAELYVMYVRSVVFKRGITTQHFNFEAWFFVYLKYGNRIWLAITNPSVLQLNTLHMLFLQSQCYVDVMRVSSLLHSWNQLNRYGNDKRLRNIAPQLFRIVIVHIRSNQLHWILLIPLHNTTVCG